MAKKKKIEVEESDSVVVFKANGGSEIYIPKPTDEDAPVSPEVQYAVAIATFMGDAEFFDMVLDRFRQAIEEFKQREGEAPQEGGESV